MRRSIGHVSTVLTTTLMHAALALSFLAGADPVRAFGFGFASSPASSAAAEPVLHRADPEPPLQGITGVVSAIGSSGVPVEVDGCAADPVRCMSPDMPPLSDRFGPVFRKPRGTRHLCQLTGKYELEQTQIGGGAHLVVKETPVDTWASGVFGTDLGVSTTRDGRTYFFFGDTWGITLDTDWNLYRERAGWGGADSWAFTDEGVDPEADTCPHLQFAIDKPGEFSSTTLRNPDGSGIGTSSFEVPTGAVTVNGQVYVFYTTDAFWSSSPKYEFMLRSVLGRLRGTGNDALGNDLDVVYEVTSHAPPADPLAKPTAANVVQDAVERGKFIHVSPVLVPAGSVPLPFAGDAVFLFGGGWRYRSSFLYLAVVPADQIENRAAWLFYRGMLGGEPAWGSLEEDALPLFSDFGADGLPNVGEFSVQWNPQLRQWLLLYGGVSFRSADRPWGPWSSERLAQNGSDPADGAACRFKHDFRPVRCAPNAGDECVCLPWESCGSVFDSLKVQRCDAKGAYTALAPDATGWTPKTYCGEVTYPDGHTENVLNKTCDAIHDFGESWIEDHDHLEHPLEGGGLYGAYIVDAFTRPGALRDTSDVYWTVSTWVPYQSHLQKTTFARIREDGFEPNDFDPKHVPDPRAFRLIPGVEAQASFHVPWDRDVYEIEVGDVGDTPIDPNDPDLERHLDYIRREYGDAVAEQVRAANEQYAVSCRRLRVVVKASDVDDVRLRLLDAQGNDNACGRTLPNGDFELAIETPGRYFLQVDGSERGDDVGYYTLALEYQELGLCRQPLSSAGAKCEQLAKSAVQSEDVVFTRDNRFAP